MPFHELPRENEPHKSDTCFSNKDIQTLKMHQSNRTSNQLLSFLSYPGGHSVTKYQAPLPSGYDMFGDEMVKGFIEFLYCGRFGILARIYPTKDQQIALRQRFLLPMDLYAHIIRANPNQEMAAVEYTIANLKRFGATGAKLTPKVRNVKEDVERLFATGTSIGTT